MAIAVDVRVNRDMLANECHLQERKYYSHNKGSECIPAQERLSVGSRGEGEEKDAILQDKINGGCYITLFWLLQTRTLFTLEARGKTYLEHTIMELDLAGHHQPPSRTSPFTPLISL